MNNINTGGPAFPTIKPLEHWGDPNQGMTTEQPLATAADGKTELIDVHGHPILVKAVDFNRLHAENEALRELLNRIERDEQLLRQALEALKRAKQELQGATPLQDIVEVIAALRAALEQPEQLLEPEGRCRECLTYNGHQEGCSKATPQTAPWVGLTAKDLAEIPASAYEGAIWADAKLRDKNGY